MGLQVLVYCRLVLQRTDEFGIIPNLSFICFYLRVFIQRLAKSCRAPFIFKDMVNNRCDVFSVGIVIVDTFHLARAFRDTFACGYFPWRTDGHSG